jgi:hypothetical protein
MKPNLDHVATIEDNEDEVIIMHRPRRSKHRVVDDEEDDDEDVKVRSRKKLKMPSLLPDQTLMSHFFSKTPNLDHVSTIEDNEDEVIVLHRQSKRRVEVDQEEWDMDKNKKRKRN